MAANREVHRSGAELAGQLEGRSGEGFPRSSTAGRAVDHDVFYPGPDTSRYTEYDQGEHAHYRPLAGVAGFGPAPAVLALERNLVVTGHQERGGRRTDDLFDLGVAQCRGRRRQLGQQTVDGTYELIG